MLWPIVFTACLQDTAREPTHSGGESTPVNEEAPEEEAGNPEIFGDPPPQLEAFTIDTSWNGSFSGASTISVVGGERDWSLAVEDADFVLHSPGTIDLSHLDGRAVSVMVTEPLEDDGERSIAISDDLGPAYFGGPGAAALLVDHYGEDMMTYGETVAQAYEATTDSLVLIGYTMVDIKTDDGVVSVLPGELTPVIIDGQQWEVVVHGSYRVLSEESDVDCVTRHSVFSLEMIRTDASRQDIIERPAGTRPVAYGCG